MKISAWTWVLGIYAIALGLGLHWAQQETERLDGLQIGAIAHAVDVSIGLAAAYMVLDGFRYHQQLGALLNKQGINKDDLILRFQNGLSTPDEKAFLGLYWFARDEEVTDAVSGAREEVRNCDFARSWRFVALAALLVHRLDRKILIVTLILLSAWQMFAAYFELIDGIPFGGLTSRLPIVVLAVVVFGYIVPGIAYIVQQITLFSLRQSIPGWLKSIAQIINKDVPAA